MNVTLSSKRIYMCFDELHVTDHAYISGGISSYPAIEQESAMEEYIILR